MKFFLVFISLFISIFFIGKFSFAKDYLENTTDIERLKIWEEVRDTILPDAPIEEVFDYACLYLSINPENLDVYKGGFVRYGKVNKKKINGYIELIENESYGLSDCNFSTN